MSQIDVIGFRGEIPKLDARKLPLEAAVSAVNLRISSGDLEAWKELLDITASLEPGHVRSIFLYENTHWFSWNEVVHAVRSPIAQDAYKRIYFTGEGVPKVTSNLIATGGDPKPVASYVLGIPAPVSEISISSVTADPDAGVDLSDTSDDETRFYRMTQVSGYGEEGPAGPPSAAVELQSPKGDIVNLNLPSPLTNTQNITHKRIYRTATGGTSTEYFLVAEVPLATATFADDVLSGSLGPVLSTDDFDPPPDNMQGLVMGINGIAAGFADNEFIPSEAFLPYAYPIAYRRTTDHDIVAQVATATGFVVVTEGYPYLFSGVSPDAMSSQKLDVMQACASGRSLVDMGEFAIYASPDGLVAAGESRAELISKDLFSRREWQNFYPETIHAYRYEEKYIAFYGDEDDDGDGIGGFIFDTSTGDFIELDFYACAGYSDLLTDTLYLVIKNGSSFDLKAWDRGAASLPYQWKSKIYRGDFTQFSAAKVSTTDPVNVGFKLWADGKLVANYPSLRTESFRLPSVRANEWQFQLNGTAAVQSIKLGLSMAEVS